MKYIICLNFVFCLLACSSRSSSDEENAIGDKPGGMVFIKGGQFTMGTDDKESYDHERPAHLVSVNSFWIDETEVTNAQYEEFIKATGYVTVAEMKPDWEELKKQVSPGTLPPPDSLMQAGSLVFHAPTEPVMLNDYTQWWEWKKGVNWRHPDGPDSDISGKANYPVVHIAYEDALAFAKWKGKRLPTEAEWEYASRGGKQERYVWGEEVAPQGKFMANTFQGSFPVKNLVEDGFESASPVKSFPPNNYGLYDMIGNVWEWTSDWYDANYFQTLARNAITENPKGPNKSYDPQDPFAMKRVTKGGSFLCASNYCVNYRPSARQATAFDSGQSHIGFRCVKDN